MERPRSWNRHSAIRPGGQAGRRSAFGRQLTTRQEGMNPSLRFKHLNVDTPRSKVISSSKVTTDLMFESRMKVKMSATLSADGRSVIRSVEGLEAPKQCILPASSAKAAYSRTQLRRNLGGM